MQKQNSTNIENWQHLRSDIALILLSIIVAVLIAWTGLLGTILQHTADFKVLSTLIAGMFFTSFFTTPLAIVALGNLALTHSIWFVALWGAIGAVLGDIVIFLFIRDRFAVDLAQVVSLKRHKRLKHLAKLRIIRWLTFGVGALIIASPLPDELGLTMMGFSKMSLRWLIPISLVMNFLGIVLIGSIARL